MSDFLDKQGRLIRIEVDDSTAYAYHNGRKVGIVLTTGLQEVDDYTAPEPAKILNWDVDSAYQRAGIASEMVRQLVDEIGTLIPADPYMGVKDDYALTPEGLRLTQALQAQELIYPFRSEPDDCYNDDEN